MKKIGTPENYTKSWEMGDLLDFTNEIGLDISNIQDDDIFEFVNNHIDETKELLAIKGYM